MRTFFFLCGSILLICFLLVGCNADLARTSQETDEKVYKIIDHAWKDDFGSKENYRIQTSFSEPNDSVLFQENADSILKLPQAVALATEYNRLYNTEKETLYLSALDQTDIRHLYEPMPFAGGQTGYLRDSDGELVNEQFGTFAAAGFQQLLATGAQIGTEVGLGWIDILSGDMRSGFATVFSAAVTQPLLRGAGRKVALENLTQAERNTLYQVRTFNRFRKTFVTSIVTEYYLVLLTYDQWQNAQDYYIQLAKICHRLEKRAKSGRVPKHELEQAEQDRLIALADYVQAQKDYKAAMDAFKLQLSIRPDTEFQLDINELDILRQDTLEAIELSEQQAIALALNQRLDIANAADTIIDADRKVYVAADAIRAELNLIGITTIESTEVLPTDSLSMRSTQRNYQLSAQLDLPIDRLFEKNNYRRALITLIQQQRLYQQQMDTAVLEVRNSYRNMQEARRRYKIETESVELAELRSNHTFMLLQYARANTRDVLDAEEDLLDARNAATAALVDYVVASIEFLRDTGTMKVKSDGMWEKSSDEIGHSELAAK